MIISEISIFSGNTFFVYLYMELAKKCTSEELDFKVFWGPMPPEPLEKAALRPSMGQQPPSINDQPLTLNITENSIYGAENYKYCTGT